MFRGAAALVFLALGCGLVLTATRALTAERIQLNRAAAWQAELRALVGDRPLPAVPEWQGDVWQLPCLTLVRLQARGYGGSMDILTALAPGADTDAASTRLHGFRVTRHQETPGIADFLTDGAFLAGYRGLTAERARSLDTVSGATITSRALHRSLAGLLAAPPAVEGCP